MAESEVSRLPGTALAHDPARVAIELVYSGHRWSYVRYLGTDAALRASGLLRADDMLPKLPVVASPRAAAE